jgi:hypothetical protein
MVTRLGRMSSHHEGVSPSTDLSTRSRAVRAESRQSPLGYSVEERVSMGKILGAASDDQAQ